MKKYLYFNIQYIYMARKNEMKMLGYLYAKFGNDAEEIFNFLVKLYGKKRVMKMIREIVFDFRDN